MSYEVEVKYRVEHLSALLETLETYGGVFGAAVEEHDRFYQHPQRDFAQTDEGLRIRTKTLEGVVQACVLTYKGPKIDPLTKMRREIEVALAENDLNRWDEILQVLGFTPGGRVDKIRRLCNLTFEETRFEISLDFLPALAEANAWFLEIEAQAEEAEKDALRDALLLFASKLPLGESERRGYLELILESQNSQPP